MNHFQVEVLWNPALYTVVLLAYFKLAQISIFCSGREHNLDQELHDFWRPEAVQGEPHGGRREIRPRSV